MNVVILTDRPELPQVEHNYNKALRWLQANGKLSLKRGAMFDIEIRHDSGCSVFDGHLCDCRPDILINGKRLKYPAKAIGR